MVDRFDVEAVASSHAKSSRGSGRATWARVTERPRWIPDFEAVSEFWLAAARLEHASIASFAHVALDLLATGAPPDLVARAHDAARDEVVHARDAYTVASRFAGRTLAPTGLPAARSFVAETTEATLRRLGVEAIVDGVVGEGAAARGLMEAAESCVDPGLAEILRRTSVDEARHAELAWDVFVWVRARGVRGLEWYVDEALAKLSRSASSVRSPHRPAIDLSRFGGLRDGREAAIILEAVANVRARVAAGSGGAVGGATERRAS